MKVVYGTFNGTGADVWICCGFVPDEVRMWELELATTAELYWNKMMMRAAETAGGMAYAGADLQADELTAQEGITPYYGGDTLVTGSGTLGVGTTTYGEGVYLYEDPQKDYRLLTNASLGITGDATDSDITTWTLDTASANTGHFNDDVLGTYIGEGSTILIDAGGKLYEAGILALTATQGEADNEVTLSWPVIPSGVVRRISGMYSFKPMTAGMISPAGFKCDYAWTNNNIVAFTATKWG